MSAAALARKFEINRSTMSNWINNKPRYPEMTRLALKGLKQKSKKSKEITKNVR
jgi:hypothetical protein